MKIKIKKIFIIIPFILVCFGTCLFLFILTQNDPVKADISSSCVDIQIEEKEVVYERLECQYCKCEGYEDKLFTFFGKEASCFEKDTQNERFRCLQEYSYPKYDCEDEGGAQAVEDCMEKYQDYDGMPYKYYLGGKGSFVNSEALEINGSRTYLNGFRGGEHNFYTGLLDQNNINPLTFTEESRNVIINRDLMIREGLNINSPYGGIFLDSNTSYGRIDYSQPDMNKRTKGIVEVDRKRGLGAQKNVSGEEYSYIQSGYKNMMTFKKDVGNNINQVFIKKGAKVHGDVRSEEMFLQGRELQRSSAIRGSAVMYYR